MPAAGMACAAPACLRRTPRCRCGSATRSAPAGPSRPMRGAGSPANRRPRPRTAAGVQPPPPRAAAAHTTGRRRSHVRRSFPACGNDLVTLQWTFTEPGMTAQSAKQDMLPDALRKSLHDAEAQVNSLVLGKAQAVRFALTALLSNGHLLIEDLPGLGKTTLAHALAATLGLGFQRVQFTSDLLPSDIVGVSVYDAQAASFTFHPGPVFAHVLLADEINRAPPRTQSALLEAMAEHQVTVDGSTHLLPDPFFVIATQNPVDLAGTYP